MSLVFSRRQSQHTIIKRKITVKIPNNVLGYQFPYLVDTNTETAMFESKDIIDYLNQTYG